ncbi:MAG: DUF6483 family protein [Deinococcales bacterium]
MPIRDDLILRMLDQVSEVVARVLTGRSPDALPEAERELASAYQELTGSGRALVGRLSSEQLLAILGAPSRFNRERGYVLARLLEADAALVEAREGGASVGGADEAGVDGALPSPDAGVARLKALDLYLEAARAGLDEEDLEERIDALAAMLAELELPAASHWRLFDHAAAGGRFAEAEDLLFDGVERFGTDRDVAERGRAFYRELEGRSDAELEAGALPRAEVGEGRDAFEAELSRAPQPGTG